MQLVRYARRLLNRESRRRRAEDYGPDFHLFAKRHFDPAFYLASNPDVARSGHDAITHWIDHGLREERVFSPDLTVRLVPTGIQRDRTLTYLSFGTDLLEVRNSRRLPSIVL